MTLYIKPGHCNPDSNLEHACRKTWISSSRNWGFWLHWLSHREGTCSHVLFTTQELVSQGYKVRAVVRNKDDEEKTAHLQDANVEVTLFPHGGAQPSDAYWKFFNGDLSKLGSYDEAFEGADAVIHR